MTFPPPLGRDVLAYTLSLMDRETATRVETALQWWTPKMVIPAGAPRQTGFWDVRVSDRQTQLREQGILLLYWLLDSLGGVKAVVLKDAQSPWWFEVIVIHRG